VTGNGGEGGAEETRRSARPYSIAVGILFLAIAIFAGVNSLSQKPLGLKAGDPVPKFAAPSATGTLEGDANVTQSRACSVKGRDVIRICDFFDRPLVLTAWFSRCGGHCEPQLDRVERIRGRFPRVAFLGLDVRDSLDKARKTVLRHGWRFPMAVDRDGAVSALFGVVVGPTTFFIYPRSRPGGSGVLREVVRHELDERDLERRVTALERAARARQRSARAPTSG
jgi:peroxiredoxin